MHACLSPRLSVFVCVCVLCGMWHMLCVWLWVCLRWFATPWMLQRFWLWPEVDTRRHLQLQLRLGSGIGLRRPQLVHKSHTVGYLTIDDSIKLGRQNGSHTLARTHTDTHMNFDGRRWPNNVRTRDGHVPKKQKKSSQHARQAHVRPINPWAATWYILESPKKYEIEILETLKGGLWRELKSDIATFVFYRYL